MNPERRRQLEERRQALQKQIELDERRALLAYHTSELDKAGVSYEIEFDTDPLVEWVFGRFPTTMRGLLWTDVAGHRCEAGDDGIILLARELHAAGAIAADDEVHVLFSNGRTPALRIHFADILAHGPLLASDFEVWLLCRQRECVFEYLSDRGWCCGFAAGS